MHKEAHIPTIIGIIILLIGMAGIIFLIENNPALSIQAAIQNSPQHITIANVSDNQFSVGWLTGKPTISYVKYSQQGDLLNQGMAYDIRDADSQSQTPRYSHLVTVSNLKSNTAYVFSINNDKTYSVNTFAKIPAPKNSLNPAFGKIENDDKNPADILLIGNLPGGQTVATTANNDNTWIMPLNSIREESGSDYYNFNTKELFTLQFIGKNSKSQVKFSYDNASPLPLVRLGENYNFANLKSKLFKLFISNAYASETNIPFKVVFPTNGIGIPTQKPVFKGTGNPKQNVLITLNGPTVLSKKIIIPDNGSWNLIPDKELIPGKYSASFVYLPLDLKKPETIGLNFMILKSGTSVLGDATPSATLKPSPSASPSPSKKPSPSPKLQASPSAKLNVPTTGNTSPAIAIMVLGGLMLIAGIASLTKKHYYKN